MAWSDWMADEEWVQIRGQMVQDSDWRCQLQPGSRQRMEISKGHIPFSGQEELNKIDVRFEEEVYTAATSQDDYMRKISWEMLTMESDSQSPFANSLQSVCGSNIGNPQDPASLDSSPQTGNANGGDWQEEIYQKIKSMNEMYQLMHAMQQSQQQQSQMHSTEGRMNFQMQPMNVQGYVVNEQHNNLANLQHSYLYSVSNASNARQNMMDSLQSGSGIDSGLGNGLNQMQKVSMNSLQQNHVGGAPQMNINSLSSQNGLASLQPNVNLQASSNIHLQQQINQEQQMFSAQQLKQYQNRQMQMHRLQQQKQQTASLDSSTQTGNASGGDWQEEIYQKIKAMNEKYFHAMNELYQFLAFSLQRPGALPHRLEKHRFVKIMLGRFLAFLRTNKNEVKVHHKDKIVGVEKQIVNILNLMRSDGGISFLSVVQQGHATASNARRRRPDEFSDAANVILEKPFPEKRSKFFSH